ncbi:MAG: L,D-transpeptidase family protein [Moraxellaceae bacterium]|nr:L,D-transpeptidase family protein [Moraxellaceae bacterium]
MRFLYAFYALILSSYQVYALPNSSAENSFAHLAQGTWQGEETVIIKKGDTLFALSGRYATTPNDIAINNGITRNQVLRIGQKLNIKYNHLIPANLADGITINLPQRLLFLQKTGQTPIVYALGLGRASWETPIGTWTIINKQKDKAWIVPKSIQAEMAAKGQKVLTRVEAGANNPLGKYWLGLSLSGYGIHGTLAPASIYRFQSHGCIRLHPDDIAQLFSQVEVGVTGTNTYWPILLEIRTDGRIMIEVHPDIYQRSVNSHQALQQLAETHAVNDKIDWTLADSALKATTGVPVDITAAVR